MTAHGPLLRATHSPDLKAEKAWISRQPHVSRDARRDPEGALLLLPLPQIRELSFPLIVSLCFIIF